MEQFTVIAVITKTYTLGSASGSGLSLKTGTQSQTSSLKSSKLISTTTTQNAIFESESISTSLSLSTFKTITTTSDITPQVTSSIPLSNSSISNSSSSSSTNIGLAIGLPVAVLGIFFLAALGWWCFKRKQFQQRRKDHEPFKDDKYLPPIIDQHIQPNNPQIQPYDNLKGSSTSSEYGSIVKKPAVAKPIVVENGGLRQSIINKFTSAEIKLPTPQTPTRISNLFSPMILKRFHLTKPSKEKQNEPEINNESKIWQQPNLNSSNVKPSLSLDNLEKKDTDKIPVPERKNISTVIRGYEKVFEDEMTVTKGDLVTIIRVHADGWCLARNESTGSEGMIPQMCLKYKSYSKA